MSDYDVVVIGAGPGGYVAAIRCAQLGMSVACVDAWENSEGEPALGGTCLNVGCIPSKALLDSSHHFYQLTHGFVEHGIKVEKVTMDVGAMLRRKDKIVSSLTGGISTLFIKHKIDWIKGYASVLSENRIRISSSVGVLQSELKAKSIIIATGSVPLAPKGITIDNKNIVDSTGALSFQSYPKRLCVLGGGVIGLELGSVWNRLGSKTTVLIRGDSFLKPVDQQIAKQVFTELKNQGLEIKTGASIVNVVSTTKTVKVTYTDELGEHTELFDKLLVATGRKPNTDKLNAEEAGLIVDDRGYIKVDELYKTNLPNIYAIGDVIGGPMLAHKASEEGIAVAERIAGQHSQVNYNVIPWVIYTWPEIAWVGKTAEQLDALGQKYNKGVFPFRGNGRALAQGESTGMVKILSDAVTDEILGVHIFGPNASELIAEAVVAMEFKASAEDLARTVHAHPTLSEAIHEAALAVDKRAIHY